MNRYQKFNKFERVAERKATIERKTQGYGIYVFKNHTKGELMLPKPAVNGKRRVMPGEEFEGDNYFLSLVKSNMLVLVREVTSPEQQRKDVEMEKKLLLDQPDTVTTQGKVEHVVVETKPTAKSLTESKTATPPTQVLLNEGPADMDGIEIVQ